MIFGVPHTREGELICLLFNFLCVLFYFIDLLLLLLFQLGVAVGFLFPPMIVRNHDDLNLISRDLRFMFYSVAVFTSFVFIAIVTGKTDTFS